MDRVAKEQQVVELKEKLGKAMSLVVADYRGLNVPTVTGLRDLFRKDSCEYKVYKNTLVKRAIAGTPMEPLGKYLEGPTAIMFSWDSPSLAAKVATTFAKTQEKFKVKGAYFDGSVFDAQGVEGLAKMPGKNELRATLLATLMAPAQNLVATLAAGPMNFMYLLAAQEKNLGGAQQG